MVNRDEIIRMAHEADCLDTQHYGSIWVDKLIRFAELVAVAEREKFNVERKAIFGIDT